MAPSEKKHEPLPVYFSPSLYDQRRMWVMGVLRKERVSEIFDVGCGDGSLLACLCNAPPWLNGAPGEASDYAATAPASEAEPLSYVHARRLVGLDVAAGDLEMAVQMTAPTGASTEEQTTWSHEPRRWEALQVTILQGSFVDYNPDMCDVECIVSTEVIEHLHADVLPHFAAMLLGVYAPRILLITTPSYDYNARFHDPSTPEGLRGGYPDPTGRTGRVFRHADHKFEWTRAEFADWCSEAARHWGYDLVECSTRGRCTDEDDWGRDPVLGGASQVASFRRREEAEDPAGAERRRSEREERAREYHQTKHVLLAKHVHDADSCAGRPLAVGNIHQHLHDAFIGNRTRVMSVYQLWLSGKVSQACGGWIGVLLDAISSCQDLSLKKLTGTSKDEWDVEYSGALPLPEPQQDFAQVESDSESDLDEDEDEGELDRITPDSTNIGSSEWDRWDAPLVSHSTWDRPQWNQETPSSEGWGWPQTQDHGRGTSSERGW